MFTFFTFQLWPTFLLRTKLYVVCVWRRAWKCIKTKSFYNMNLPILGLNPLLMFRVDNYLSISHSRNSLVSSCFDLPLASVPFLWSLPLGVTTATTTIKVVACEELAGVKFSKHSRGYCYLYGATIIKMQHASLSGHFKWLLVVINLANFFVYNVCRWFCNINIIYLQTHPPSPVTIF